MKTLQQIAEWNTSQNPLEHVLGGDAICPTLLTDSHGIGYQTILISPDFDEPEKDLRGIYMDKAKIKTANARGYDEAEDGDAISLQRPDSETRRGRVGHGVAQTIDTAGGEGRGVIIFDAYNHRDISANETVGTLTTNAQSGMNAGTFYVGQPPRYRIRKLTERECFRLMGVRDEDSARLAKHQPKSSMYHLAGDSIVTACLMGIFGELLGVEWESKVQELQTAICGKGDT